MIGTVARINPSVLTMSVNFLLIVIKSGIWFQGFELAEQQGVKMFESVLGEIAQ